MSSASKIFCEADRMWIDIRCCECHQMCGVCMRRIVYEGVLDVC